MLAVGFLDPYHSKIRIFHGLGQLNVETSGGLQEQSALRSESKFATKDSIL
jgi:hypothetical protein